ncbi:hypothetical protein SteCoe_28114 [Stentor coeruleus]|uniref:Protein kinase domain-containing protein n=1 Tax=Stentor coeruleus TaxID=5963 RepID=A0A1R2B909_9CILI|nr:hypothetical protein SteCoe_28114 [Stentor coeruleus]
MSDLPLDLELLIIKTLKVQALVEESKIPNDCKLILTNPTSLGLEELLIYSQKIGGQSESLLAYMLGLIILRVSKDAPLNQKQGLQYFETFKYFIDKWPEYQENTIKTYFPALIKELLATDNLNFPFWAQKISVLQLPEPLAENAKKFLRHQCLFLTYMLLEKLQNTSDTQTILEFLDFFIGINNINLDITTAFNMSISCILENLITDYDLRDYKKYLGEKVKDSFNELKNLVEKIKTLNGLNDENIKKIRVIEKEIYTPRTIYVYNYERKKKCYFQDEELKIGIIDWNQMQTDPNAVYNYNTESFNVNVTRIWFPNGLVMIRKSYTEIMANIDFRSVENEIRILTFLSNRAQDYNCYLKFFGAAKDYGKFHLYMEEGGKALMQVLTEYKNNNVGIELSLLETWIITLLQCFAELALNRIYHCDINPNNILINQNNTIKVVGFGFAQCLTNSESFIVKNTSQITKDYMAPELLANLDVYLPNNHIKLGKSDVFSLGLTFFQIITLSDITGYNTLEKNAELHLIIDNLVEYPQWIRNLLHAMLYPTGEKRPGFNKCLAYVHEQKKNLETSIL